MKKITLFFVFLMMSAVAFNAAAASNLRGDVNGNGEVDISDVTALIGYVLTGNGSSLNLANADCTLNGEIDISDVTCLIDYVLRGTWPGEAHEWVDLGLPSGTLWATCNIGADSPEEYGDYFSWGETEPKAYYYWDSYKWCNGTYTELTKYNTQSDHGPIDNKTELDLEDDAAYVNWGTSWRIPSKEQVQELFDNCSNVWTTQNGVNGRLFTGPNGKTMFIPAAGFRYSTDHYEKGTSAQYWSRRINSTTPHWTYCLYFHSDSYYVASKGRSLGLPVRPVRVSQN